MRHALFVCSIFLCSQGWAQEQSLGMKNTDGQQGKKACDAQSQKCDAGTFRELPPPKFGGGGIDAKGYRNKEIILNIERSR
ncbi:hypothetical protein [Methylobacterium sp. JK268]